VPGDILVGQYDLGGPTPAFMRMSELVVLITILLGGCAVQIIEETPQFILIVRERLRPGSEEAYDKNESQLAAVCATLRCPHPYLALASTAGPKEVWWLNAFASQEQRDGLAAAYAGHELLMAAMRPLGKRKEGFRETFTSTTTTYRRDLSGDYVLRIAGARFMAIDITQDRRSAAGAVFEASDGTQFVIASANTRTDAENLAGRFGPGAKILAVQPQWSFPATAWVKADPMFWQTRPLAR
jgi:hypothetical protein